ncbi:hypothetical protein HETIRDRAFT_166745 [Heterobasidion irregulare TC 32-1]|uniref:Uncharacterized protein n=1 Tax=Heterobasidion irregulare (strain TC 32-1) TaxID=747525 RepID=W4KNB4_HETIT|nr:uncharacterized protein HETIRDRAFT_166745 [Heterobasidion irregulare TC 32-1]ETW87209.1 hypothetical protein HETIRDRAFT_166745 [Heterobasidion irregulare TC 32-1]
MISLLPQATHLAQDGHQDTLQMNELGNVRDALKPTTELLSRSVHDQSVRLYCTVPTWAPSSDLCIDLHDLHDLRSRSLLFIHNLVESLRASGVCHNRCSSRFSQSSHCHGIGPSIIHSCSL